MKNYKNPASSNQRSILPSRRRSRTRFISLLIVVLALILVGVSYSASSFASRGVSDRNIGSSTTASATAGSSQIRPNIRSLFLNEAFSLVPGPMPVFDSISTFAADCQTPKTSFNLGDTVCVVVSGVLLGPPVQRRIEWADPSGLLRLSSDVTTDPQSNTFTLPTSQTSTIGGVTVDNRGTWLVNLTDASDASIRNSASFVVKDPAAPAADLALVQSVPTLSAANANVSFTVQITNKGPDTAQTVLLSDSVPANTTFVSQSQNGGPAFTCVNPPAGNTGASTCTVAALAKDDLATLIFVYKIDGATPDDTRITNTATIRSTTTERNAGDNSADATTIVATNVCKVTCPANIVQGTDPDQFGATVNYPAPTTSGNCGDLTENYPSGSFFPVGTTQVVIGGQSGSPCSFTITINDTQTPSISCPANITTTESPAGSGSATVNYPAPTVTDNDPQASATCDHPSGSSFPVGTTTVTCTATDRANNSSSCTFTVTVESATGCTLNCPQNITVNNDTGDCGAIVTYPDATSSNGCPSGTISYSQASGTRFPVGTTTVTATRSTGEICRFNVTVVDAQAPTITCPSNVTATAPQGQCAASVDPGTPTTSDNCPGVTVNGTRSDNAALTAPYPVGTTVITWTAKDRAGNTASCEQTVTVTETVPPTINCPANITTVNDPGTCSASVDPGQATATDNCGNPTVTAARNDGRPLTDPYPVGMTTITWTATDGSGNHSSCQQTITVNDDEKPVITCPANITRNTDPGACSANIDPGQATATDNCGASVSGTRSDGQPLNAPYPKGTTTITWTATDPSGNTASCQQTITVNDTEKPVITCPSDITVSSPVGSCSTNLNPGTATATDNCGSTTITASRSDGQPLTAPFPNGSITITWTATDSSGNSASCDQKITVLDTEKPTITCPANVNTSTDPGECSAHVNPGTATATDNCGSATVTGTRSDGQPLNAPYPKGTTTITWTATDSSGNQSSCTQTVTVNDTEPPAITCPANITTNADPGACSANVNPGMATASDNCGSTTVTGTRSDGRPLTDPYPVGTTTITWTATDSSGNRSSCMQTVTVIDNQAPTITTNGQTPSMWPPNHTYHTFNVTDFVTGVSDNCNSLSPSDVIIALVTSDEAENGPGSGNTLNDIVISADCKSVQLRAERESGGDGRVYTITFRVRDTSGNVGTATSRVIVPVNIGGTAVDSGPHYTVTGTCP